MTASKPDRFLPLRRGIRHIVGGIICPACGHERFKFMKVCPACEDKVLREFDTSTKIRQGREEE